MINKILGLDLGSASIGWALVSEDLSSDNPKTDIIDLGCRIIPYEGTEGQDFTKGAGESKNSVRTGYRSARRGYDRYQLRREFLVKVLIKNNMMPDDDLKNLNKNKLWELRSNAAKQKISLQELGRILLLLNQKRGYKSSRSDSNIDKKDPEYVAIVKNRYDSIRVQNLTIGQFFYEKIKEDDYFRIKENVFPREAYIEEFDIICNTQKEHYPLLTNELINKLRDEIIFYQRPLKSQKGLVSTCEFEGFSVVKDGKEYFTGPKVAHKSSPLFQIVKMWESINNLSIKTRDGDELYITVEQRNKIFEHLDNNDKLTVNDLCNILKIKKDDLYVDKKLFNSGLQGNNTKNLIKKCFRFKGEYEHLLNMDLKIVEDISKMVYLYSKKTGEINPDSVMSSKIIDKTVEKDPLYRLWHTIYSINETEECSKALQKNFGIDPETAIKLASIDFNKMGYGNKSVKTLRKILPYLADGYNYADAMTYAGYNHSGSLTKDENLSRELLELLKPLPKNSLRQPIVEKILNQMVNLVNEVIKQYGRPDEIRVELARELKQSKEERSDTEKFINKRNRENEIIANRLGEYGLRATRNNIIKWRLYQEIDNEEQKLNAMCIYCGKNISLTEAIKGYDVDIEHIIPKSKLFDDSQSNKTLAHRHCNSNKGNMTAYDFMKAKSQQELDSYIERVNSLFKNSLISKTKRNKLLMSEKDIPDNFIDRQLRESQYISKKAREILSTICHNVWCTSGTITSELRRLWGWEDVTMSLQLPKYRSSGLTEMISWESDHGRNSHEKEVIKGWTKRDDHRHHAVDALAIACTKQGYIQRFNTLNTQKTRDEIEKNVSENNIRYKEKLSTLEKYIVSRQPLSVKEVEDAVSSILVSIKSGKKVISKGTRKVGNKGNKRVVQTGVIIPRGSLSEKNVYGKINVIEKNKPLKYLFDYPNLIVKNHFKQLINTRIDEQDGDSKKAYLHSRKNPIYLDKDNSIPLEFASCYKEEYVIKYPVNTNFNKVDKVVDLGLKIILEKRLRKFNNNPKEAFKDVKIDDENSIKWYQDEGLTAPIYSVRCLTGLSAVVPVRKDKNGADIGFVKPGNNHHIVFYYSSDGALFEHVCSFWHAVERRKYGIPSIINDSNELWDSIQQRGANSFPESFLEQLPPPNSKLHLSLQQNEMFILGLPEEEVKSLIDNRDYKTICNYLYRVQKIAKREYYFRHHLETQLIDNIESKTAKRYFRIQSIPALISMTPVKVRLNILGKIIL